MSEHSLLRFGPEAHEDVMLGFVNNIEKNADAVKSVTYEDKPSKTNKAIPAMDVIYLQVPGRRTPSQKLQFRQ